MNKIFKIVCALTLTFTMLAGTSTSLYADTSNGTLTWVNEQYIWADEGNHYYLTADNARHVPLEDVNNDGINDSTLVAYEEMYSSAGFEDPIEDENGYYTGSQLATYELESTSLPSEMTFEVYGQNGTIESLTIDTSATNSIKLGYDFVKHGTSQVADYSDTTLYIWDDNVVYEIVGSSFSFDGTKSTWVVPYSANGSEYVVSFDKNSGSSVPVNVVIEDVTPVTPIPPTGNGETNDDTKVVNGPTSANALMVVAASGTAAAVTLTTITRRK